MVVTHAAGPLLARCLAALAADAPAGSRVTVVVSHAERHPVPAPGEALYLDANPGFAVAANRGLARALDALAEAPAGRGLVLLLNDDTEVRPGFFAALTAAAAEGPPGILQPRILLARRPDHNDNLGHHLFPDGFNLARGRGHTGADWPGAPGAFSGAAVAFSAEVLRGVGLFDEDLEAFGEDLDLSLRACRRGVPLRLVAEAEVEHELGATYGRSSPRKVFLVERNRLLAGVRSLPRTALVTMPLWSTVRLVALLAAASRGQGVGGQLDLRGVLAALAGSAAGLAGLPGAWRKRRADAPDWALGERQMWAHLRRSRPRWADVRGTP